MIVEPGLARRPSQQKQARLAGKIVSYVTEISRPLTRSSDPPSGSTMNDGMKVCFNTVDINRVRASLLQSRARGKQTPKPDMKLLLLSTIACSMAAASGQDTVSVAIGEDVSDRCPEGQEWPGGSIQECRVMPGPSDGPGRERHRPLQCDDG